MKLVCYLLLIYDKGVVLMSKKYLCLTLFCITALFINPIHIYSQERPAFWSKEWEEQVESFQPSDKIMDAIGIIPGMTVAEIGAGNGRFAVRVAKRVGEAGRVYANDIDQKALEFMRERCLRENITNMTIVEGTDSDSRLPDGIMDMVVLINTLHCVEKTARPLFLKNIVRLLKPDGILAIIDLNKERLIELKEPHWMAIPKETILSEIKEARFKLVAEHTFLEYDHILLFRINESKLLDGLRLCGNGRVPIFNKNLVLMVATNLSSLFPIFIC